MDIRFTVSQLLMLVFKSSQIAFNKASVNRTSVHKNDTYE